MGNVVLILLFVDWFLYILKSWKFLDITGIIFLRGNTCIRGDPLSLNKLKLKIFVHAVSYLTVECMLKSQDTEFTSIIGFYTRDLLEKIYN